MWQERLSTFRPKKGSVTIMDLHLGQGDAIAKLGR